MKFKKSISFVLTLCMVLSLFATFVIPVAAEGAASQVVENWDVANWNDGVNTSNAAYIFTDASVYSSATAFAWWRHVAFAPTATEGVYKVTEIAVGTGGEGGGLTVPENGFVWVAFEWPESGSGVYALNVMNAVEVGDSVKFTGVDFANKTAAADATAEKWVDPSAPVNVALGKEYVLSGCGNRASYYGDLTDGASVNALGNNNNVDWFGFYCNGDNMADINAPEKVGTVVIDLGAKYDISSMRTKTIAMPSWGIAAAGAINFYASADGVEYTLVGSGVVTTDEGVGYWSGTDCEVTAQFVKLEIELAGTFAFINEFEVYGTEAVVESVKLPEGAAGIDYLGYIHDAYSMVAYAEADMTLGALVNKYLGAVKDLNYCKVAVCDADGTVKAVYLTLGRPDGVKSELTISAGQFAVIYNANKTGHEVMDSINVGDTITLYNVDALKTHTGTAVALENAGFTVEAPVKLPEEATGLDYFGYTHTTLNYVMYADADTTLGDLTAKYLGSSKDLNYFKVIVVNEDGTVAATYTTLGRPDGVKSDFAVTAGQVVLALSANEVNVGRFEIVDTVKVGDIVTLYNVDLTAEPGELANAGFTVEAAPVVDDESFKETHTHVDGVNVGTIQQLGDAWADKLTLDFWYLVEDGETTVTVNYAVDNKVVLDDDTMFRVWVDADITDTARTTLYDYKVSAGEAYNAKHASSINEAIVSAEYTVVGNDYFFTLVLDKATLGIDGEYRLNLQLGQSNSTTMHSIKYDNVTGEGATYAPWNTTEFYEVFGKAPEAPVTSQVVTDWNVSDWSTSANGANGAYLFTDQEAYLACTHTWWSHISFKPTTIAGVYEVAAIRGATGEAASFEIAEGGFVLAAHDTAAAGTAGAYVHALIKSLAVGDRVIFNGLNIADLTTTADATAVLVPTAEDMDLIVSHNYNYSWHCFETQIITMAVGEAGLKKAGDAPNMTAEDTDILYIVENVDGAYLVTGVVGGKALLDVEIPENGFLYYVTKNCTGYDKICHGELVGKYLLLGDIDLATKFAIDPKVNPAYTMQAVSGFKTGDADLDGKITATDYAIIRKLVLGTLTAEDVGELVLKTADVNGNGKVDARDYYLAKRAFLGTYVIPGWEAEEAEE